MSREENTAESTGSCAEQVSTNGHNGFVIDLPADYGKRPKVNGDTEVDMNGRRPGEDGYNIFNKQSTTEKRRQQSEADAAARAVSDERLTRFGKLRFDVAALDGMNAWWARKLAAKIAAKNAALNPTTAAPELMFSGADAVNTGAGDAHIEALTALSPDEIQALSAQSDRVVGSVTSNDDTAPRQPDGRGAQNGAAAARSRMACSRAGGAAVVHQRRGDPR